jgi:hypothetical protein
LTPEVSFADFVGLKKYDWCRLESRHSWLGLQQLEFKMKNSQYSQQRSSNNKINYLESSSKEKYPSIKLFCTLFKNSSKNVVWK